MASQSDGSSLPTLGPDNPYTNLRQVRPVVPTLAELARRTHILHGPGGPVFPTEVNEGVVRLLDVHEPFPFIWGDRSSF